MFGQTCGNCRLLFVLQAGHGRGQRPAFPAPSSISRATSLQNPGAVASRDGRLASRCCLTVESAIEGCHCEAQLRRFAMIAWGVIARLESVAEARKVPGPLGLLQRSEVIEVQRSDSGALFEQTLFEVLEFEFGKVGFEEVFVTIDITQVGTQTGTALVHSHALEND